MSEKNSQCMGQTMGIKNKTKAERHHMAKVAALGCIACTKNGYEDTPAEIHHIRDGVGMSQRSSHFHAIPLCAHHHRLGNDSIHAGRSLFEEKYGTESELLLEVLNALGH